MVDYVGALKKAFSNIPNLVIGTIIAIIPIVSILLLGYAVKIIEGVSKSAKETPKWSEDIGGLIVKSILVFLIALIYMIPALIVFVVAAGALIASLASGLANPNDPNAIIGALITAGPIALLGVLLILLAAYILPSAMVSFARSGSFGSAFAIGTVIKKTLSATYFVTWIIVLILSLILMTVASMIPIIGFVVAGLFNYVITVFAYTSYAEAIKK